MFSMQLYYATLWLRGARQEHSTIQDTLEDGEEQQPAPLLSEENTTTGPVSQHSTGYYDNKTMNHVNHVLDIRKPTFQCTDIHLNTGHGFTDIRINMFSSSVLSFVNSIK